MELNEIVMKLIGPVQPIGDSGEDERRLANMKALTGLVDELLGEIRYAARSADREEASMRAIGVHAQQFLEDIDS
jgi:hypothetical protein